MSKKVLTIEDEKNFAHFVSLELQHEGYSAVVETNGRLGLQTALDGDFDLILLDLMLPDMDGFETTRRLRLEEETSIIMMTARGSIIDIVAGLDHGADDYIVKPFAIEGLLASARAVFRRQDVESKREQDSQGKEGLLGLRLNPRNRSAVRGNDEISLTKREYDLLSVPLSNANRVIAREELLASVWRYDTDIETNVVDVYIRYPRGEVDIPDKESYIQTVRGMGHIIREK